MDFDKRRVVLCTMMILFYLLAILFFYKTFDIKINCAKSIYAISGLDVGVYNRIINGSYFVGYAVIASANAICGTICLHSLVMCENCD